MVEAILPETERPTSPRSQVSIQHQDRYLIMKIEANDTSALRAALNSYLRWISLAKHTIETVEKLG